MRYQMTDRENAPEIVWHFLEVWVDDFGDVFFSLGERHRWFRYRNDGWQFDGKLATVCCYQPVDAKNAVDRQHALLAAISYTSGHYRLIEVNLGDRGY